MLHALPGMGANARMYPSPWDSLPGFAAHDWPKHCGEQTLAEIAQSVSETHKIKDGDSIIGSSLGGMVACEVTKIRKIDTLILVGSAVSREEVNRLLAFLHPLVNVAPIDWLQFSVGKAPVELAQMLTGVEASFIRAMCAAVFQWSGLGATSVRTLRIHRRNDLVIPPPAKPDLMLEAGHLIALTHPKECVEFIKPHLQSR